MRAWQSLRGADTDEEEESRNTIEPAARTRMTILYLGLAMLLGMALVYTTHTLDALRASGAVGGIR
jgi:hypothetical protein